MVSHWDVARSVRSGCRPHREGALCCSSRLGPWRPLRAQGSQAGKGQGSAATPQSSCGFLRACEPSCCTLGRRCLRTVCWAVTREKTCARVIFCGAGTACGARGQLGQGGMDTGSGTPAGISTQRPLAPFYFAIQRQLLRQVGAGWEEELAVSVPDGRRSAGVVLS